MKAPFPQTLSRKSNYAVVLMHLLQNRAHTVNRVIAVKSKETNLRHCSDLRKAAVRRHQNENVLSLHDATSQETQTKQTEQSNPSSQRHPFTHLNVTVLGLAGLAADGLGLGPGFEHLAKGTGDWQACHTDSIC